MIVYKTGHQIADTVALAFDQDVAIGYGILRGMDKKLRSHRHWFNVDRGYFNPSHFDGYYRISYKGTQAKWHNGIPRKAGEFNLQPIVKRDGYILICPPTAAVCEFFGVDHDQWLQDAFRQLHGRDYRIRDKANSIPIETHLAGACAVITFNSSVGWEALRLGIPVLSDIEHSIVGSYFKETTLNILLDKFYLMDYPPLELFEAMNAHQFKLDDIAKGETWGIIRHYLYGLAGTAESPPAPMF